MGDRFLAISLCGRRDYGTLYMLRTIFRSRGLGQSGGGCLEKLDSWTSMVEVLWIERLVTNSY